MTWLTLILIVLALWVGAGLWIDVALKLRIARKLTKVERMNQTTRQMYAETMRLQAETNEIWKGLSPEEFEHLNEGIRDYVRRKMGHHLTDKHVH